MLKLVWLAAVGSFVAAVGVGGCSDTDGADDGNAGSGGSAGAGGTAGKGGSGGTAGKGGSANEEAGAAGQGAGGARAGSGPGGAPALGGAGNGGEAPAVGGGGAAGGDDIAGGAAGESGAAGAAGAENGPASLLGTWAGTVTQDADSYQACLTITNVTDVGSPAGTVDYPDIPCGGTFKFLGESGETFSFSEDITYGAGCLDDGYFEATLSNGSLQWEWAVSSGDAPAATALLAPVSSCPPVP